MQIDGKKLAALRRARFFTQEEVAGALDVAKGTISNYEQKGLVGVLAVNFRGLAELFKMTPDALYSEVGVPGGSLTGTDHIEIELPPKLREKLEAIAKRMNKTIEQLAIEMVQQGLNEEDRKKQAAKKTGMPPHQPGGSKGFDDAA